MRLVKRAYGASDYLTAARASTDLLVQSVLWHDAALDRNINVNKTPMSCGVRALGFALRSPGTWARALG